MVQRHRHSGNLKCDQPTNGLTGVGARDAYAPKNTITDGGSTATHSKAIRGWIGRTDWILLGKLVLLEVLKIVRKTNDNQSLMEEGGTITISESEGYKCGSHGRAKQSCITQWGVSEKVNH